MSAPRFFLATPLDRGSAGREIALPEGVAHHACRVRRLAAGDALTLFDGQGGEHAAVLTRVDRRGASVRVERFVEVERESPLTVTLVQGIAATDAMDYAVRKAVELGVAAILPVVAARGARFPAGEQGAKRLAHWRQVAVAACEQCGRNRVPPVSEPMPILRWLAERARGRSGFILAPDAATTLAHCPAPVGAFDLAIGPEGGWTAEELAAATDGALTGLRFGPRILRTETAVAAVLGTLGALWGDCR